MYQLLSYPLKKGDPTWPGNPTLDITQHKTIETGASANTCTIHLFDHYGTHFDAPFHFNPKGPAIASLPLDRFLFDSPLLLDIPKLAGEKLEPEDLIPYEDRIASCDLLLIRTGFWKLRIAAPDVYEQNGPGVSSRTARYLMDHFTDLKAIGLDFVSLASFSDPADGNLAHRYMLGTFHPHFICIIEDINLSAYPLEGVQRVGAMPLLIEGTDSCPVTMWAEL